MHIKNKKKVLFIAGRITVKNGAFHSLKSMIEEFNRMGIDSTVLLCKHGEEEQIFRGINVKCKIIPYFSCTVPADKKNILKGLVKRLINYFLEKKLSSYVKKEKFDLIHINVGTVSFGAKTAIDKNIPFIWHIREFLEEDVNMTYINPSKTVNFLKKAFCVISISKAVKKHFIKVYGLNNIVTVYNGINIAKIKRENNTVKSNPFVFAIVGRIIKEKGQLEALKAFYEVSKEHDNIRLLIVGDVDNYEYYKEIRDFILEKDIEHKVEFISHQNDLSEVWRKTNVALICSKMEGFGRVTAEFMLNNVLVIGSNTGGTIELLDNNKGILYEQGNFIELSFLMKKVIRNPKKFEKFKNNAFEYAMNNFTSIKCATKINMIYDKAIKGENNT